MTVGASVLVARVLHALDVDLPADSHEEELTFAEAIVTVRYWDVMPDLVPDGYVVHEGTLATPSGLLTLGDAEYEIRMRCPKPETRMRVVADTLAGYGAAAITIDIAHS